jgi:hypothetical protein
MGGWVDKEVSTLKGKMIGRVKIIRVEKKIEKKKK